MNRALLLVCILSAPAYAGPPPDIAEVSKLIHSNFRYRAQAGAFDEPTVQTGEAHFAGDCDDFAFAAAYQLYQRGYDAEMVFLARKVGSATVTHIIACVDGWCLDNERSKPYRERKIKGRELVRMAVSADPDMLGRFVRLSSR